MIVDVWGNTKEIFNFGSKSKVLSIALHPKYPEKDCKLFVSAVEGQALAISSMNYFGHSRASIPGGDGPIYQVSWASGSHLIAWATCSGVKVFDYRHSSPLAMVPKPKKLSESTTPCTSCVLSFKGPYTLGIGWGDCVQVAEMKPKETEGMSVSMRSSSSAIPETKPMRMLTKLQLEGYHIAGIAPFNEHLIILAIPERVNDEKSDFETVKHPELLIVTEEGDIVSSDALPLVGFQSTASKDFKLAYYVPRTEVGGRLLENDNDCMYYVVSPKDVVLATLRGVDDHVNYLLQRGQYKDALEEAERYSHELREHNVLDLAEKYLRYLMHARNFEAAAALCPRLLGENKKLWETWILVFAREGQSKVFSFFAQLIKIVPRSLCSF